MSPRQLFLAAAIAAAIGVSIGTSAKDADMTRHPPTGAVKLSIEGDLPPLGEATEWINSGPLTAASLRGHVVLIEFWTYTCINWLRTLPYVRAWAAKYKDQGLVVIGVHSPEFEFEKDLGNVRRAARDMRVDYPIAVDSEHAVWRAFRNEYWPALYFVDAQGRIRHHQFGEGEYERSEAVIQQLLTEAGARGIGRDLGTVNARGLEVAADWGDLRSPENYVGYARTQNFASPGGAVLGQRRDYAAPPRLSLNHWALLGNWTVKQEAIRLEKANGRIAYRFHARDLHLVMGPPAGAQLCAATLIEARRWEAKLAILVIQEFIRRAMVSQRRLQRNASDLSTFVHALAPDMHLKPGGLVGPIVVPGGGFVPSGMPLLIGKVTVELAET